MSSCGRICAGESRNYRFIRQAKSGKAVWLEASYFPILLDGKVIKVAKVASNVTEQQSTLERSQALLAALDKSLAVIDFQPDGTVITANQNFLHCFGYRLDEVVGQSHRMFCDEAFYQQNPNFWRDLGTAPSSPGSSCAVAATARRSGWRPPTTPSSTMKAR